MEKPTNEKPVDADSWQAFKNTIKSWSQLERRLFAGCVIIFAWLLLGMLPLAWFGDVAKSGPFGDTFGISNSFIAGLTLIIVIYSNYEQRQANLRTIEIAEKTAILQSLTFMAEFHANLMNTLKNPTSIERHRIAAQQYSQRAAAVMHELGEEPVAVEILTINIEAARELEDILAYLYKVFPELSEITTTTKANRVLYNCYDKITRWTERYGIEASEFTALPLDTIPPKDLNSITVGDPDDWYRAIANLEADYASLETQLQLVRHRLYGHI